MRSAVLVMFVIACVVVMASAGDDGHKYENYGGNAFDRSNNRNRNRNGNANANANANRDENRSNNRNNAKNNNAVEDSVYIQNRNSNKNRNEDEIRVARERQQAAAHGGYKSYGYSG